MGLVFTDIASPAFATSPPVVTSVGVLDNGTYVAGQDLDFTVTWIEAVTVDTTDGTPSLALTLTPGGTVQASCISGSGTASLTFRFVVVSGDQDFNGISLGSAIALNGGSIEDTSSNNAVLALAGVASTTVVLVDAVPPTVDYIIALGHRPTTRPSTSFK